MTLVICNGMNRSGSTLQYNLVRLIVEGLDVGRGAGFVAAWGSTAERERWRARARSERWYVVKSHAPPIAVGKETAAGDLFICYIYRDIRAVAASYKRMWRIEGQALLDELDRAMDVDNALRNLSAPILRQRYERVMEDLPGAAREIAAFLHLAAPPALVEDVARACSVNNMNRVVRRLEWRLRWQGLFARLSRRLRPLGVLARRPSPVPAGAKRRMDPRTLLHPHHISATASDPDHWRRVLTAAEARLLTDRYYAWLHQAGYLATTP